MKEVAHLDRIGFVHHGAHVFPAVGIGGLCSYISHGILMRNLICEVIVCICVNDMEVAGALPKRTHLSGNTNPSRAPIRPTCPPEPEDFLRVS